MTTADNPETAFEQVRTKDRAVLEFVKGGVHALRDINDQTHDVLDGREIGYSFTKLEELGLITVETPDGTTESVIDGQRRVHQKSRRASLTEKGRRYFEWADDRAQRQKFEEASWGEVTRQVQENAEMLEAMDTRFDQLRRQMVKKFEDLREEAG